MGMERFSIRISEKKLIKAAEPAIPDGPPPSRIIPDIPELVPERSPLDPIPNPTRQPAQPIEPTRTPSAPVPLRK